MLLGCIDERSHMWTKLLVFILFALALAYYGNLAFQGELRNDPFIGPLMGEE
jgi:hypothetical protein